MRRNLKGPASQYFVFCIVIVETDEILNCQLQVEQKTQISSFEILGLFN